MVVRRQRTVWISLGILVGCGRLIGVDGDYVEDPSFTGTGGANGGGSGGTTGPKNTGGTSSAHAGEAGFGPSGGTSGGTTTSGGTESSGGVSTNGGRTAGLGGRSSIDGGAPPNAGAGGSPPIESGGSGGYSEAGAPGGGSGGTTNGGSSSGGSSQGGTLNGGAPNGGRTSGGAPNGGSASGGTTNGGQGGTNPCGQTGNSCKNLGNICGPSGNESCCTALSVPGTTSGQTFNRDNKTAAPATVSTFVMDKYEVTLGRFREFVNAYPSSKPSLGCGANPNDSKDEGWSVDWNAPALMPTDKAGLIQKVSSAACTGNGSIWSADDHTNDALPMNCLTWYTAYAFCIWDGGRLPSELEWNYAAAGGTEQRRYPWGAAALDASRAVWGGQPSAARVGSKSPDGDGRWGHSDLAGNSWEWIRDKYTGAQDYILPCADCANTASDGSTFLRGGGFGSSAAVLQTTSRVPQPNREAQTDDGGVRCVR